MVSNKFSALLTMTLVAIASASPTGLMKRQRGAPSWADESSATIHPGVNTDTAGSCTSNFVFFQHGEIYLGQAAHCASLGSSTDTNGCSSKSMPEGSQVKITGASQPGTLVYSSWIRMQQNGESDENTCAYNDLALVKIDRADHDKVNPTVPTFGGPMGLRTTSLESGELIYSYGNSILRQGITELSPKYGNELQEQGQGWSHNLATTTPGIPGDSGSGFFDGNGLAFGVLSTLEFAPITGSNGVGDLAKELAYANQFHDFAHLKIAFGTRDFQVALPDARK